MNKVLVIVKREYRAAVRTKGFLISLILLPVMMGGGLIATMVFQDKVDLTDRKIAVVDESGLVADYLIQRATDRNTNDIRDKATGEQRFPAWYFESVVPDTADRQGQNLKLSDRVRNKEIIAFIRVGKGVLHPVPGSEDARISYFSENALMDDTRNWAGYVINDKLHELRAAELGIGPDQVHDLFAWVNAESKGLTKVDERTGTIQGGQSANILQTIFVPYILMFLMFMTLMMSAIPLLNAVMEEKSERIAEVLLGTVTPGQFMMGKVLGGIAVSLTTTGIYVIGGILTLNYLDLSGIIPYAVLPWFFVYMLFNIIMNGSIFAALGSTCNDSKDAQAIQFPAMLPMIIPMFVMMPVIQNPLGTFATVASLFPPFTPMLMLVRQATGVTLPIWQPIAGLAGVILFTLLSVWAGGRIFRSCIILHGKRPKLGQLLKQVMRG